MPSAPGRYKKCIVTLLKAIFGRIRPSLTFGKIFRKIGDIVINYVLSGFQEHTLVVEGHEDELVLRVENGGTDSGTITLEAGRYILYCDIPGHREGGMEARLLVE
ncbi:MAG: hypothetical protein QF844_00735, partial [Acidimicrobiales bacterium]|nr:hypothetical protein [Acidimicrobiales bacterium]